MKLDIIIEEYEDIIGLKLESQYLKPITKNIFPIFNLHTNNSYFDNKDRILISFPRHKGENVVYYFLKTIKYYYNDYEFPENVINNEIFKKYHVMDIDISDISTSIIFSKFFVDKFLKDSNLLNNTFQWLKSNKTDNRLPINQLSDILSVGLIYDYDHIIYNNELNENLINSELIQIILSRLIIGNIVFYFYLNDDNVKPFINFNKYLIDCDISFKPSFINEILEEYIAIYKYNPNMEKDQLYIILNDFMNSVYKIGSTLSIDNDQFDLFENNREILYKYIAYGFELNNDLLNNIDIDKDYLKQLIHNIYLNSTDKERFQYIKRLKNSNVINNMFIDNNILDIK